MEHFSGSAHTFLYSTRKEFDLTSAEQTRKFFNIRYYDVVINCAINGGVRGRKDTLQDFLNNLQMFKNLVDNRDAFGKLINFGSGAEFNRESEINNCSEKEIYERNPNDYYGLSKNIITKVIYKYDKFFNIRIFGCFGEHEKKDRFIKANINNILQNNPIIIHQDKYMDFISASDLCRILSHYIESDPDILPKDLNAVYEQKYTLKNIAEMLKYYMNSESKIVVQTDGLDKPYTGCGKELKKMNLPLVGIEEGISSLLKRENGCSQTKNKKS